MRTLSDGACSEWLAVRGIAEAPYGQLPCPSDYCAQFPLPKAPLQIAYVARCVVELCEPFGETLLHFTDWPLYQPDEMAVILSIRAGYADSRHLIETPGHLFASSERDLMIGVFSLAIFYGWTAYLYFDHRTTFLGWEGELLDFWTFDHSRVAAVCEVFQRLKASTVPLGNV